MSLLQHVIGDPLDKLCTLSRSSPTPGDGLHANSRMVGDDRGPVVGDLQLFKANNPNCNKTIYVILFSDAI